MLNVAKVMGYIKEAEALLDSIDWKDTQEAARTASRAQGTINLARIEIEVSGALDPKPFPAWAHEEKYEYCLGMSTFCAHCGASLHEGQTHWVDADSGKSGPCDRYCSTKCVMEVEAP